MKWNAKEQMWEKESPRPTEGKYKLCQCGMSHYHIDINLHAKLLAALEGLHNPLRHDYEKDELKCETCTLLEEAKEKTK